MKIQNQFASRPYRASPCVILRSSTPYNFRNRGLKNNSRRGDSRRASGKLTAVELTAGAGKDVGRITDILHPLGRSLSPGKLADRPVGRSVGRSPGDDDDDDDSANPWRGSSPGIPSAENGAEAPERRRRP